MPKKIDYSVILYWIEERERIRTQKAEGKAAPWTKDEILQTYRFCNVRRMDDYVSQWVLNNWYIPNRGHENMYLACAMARYFNLPDTLQYLGFPFIWDPDRLCKALKKRKKKGFTIYNCAYLIRGGSAGAEKHEEVIYNYLDPLAEGLDVYTDSMEESVNALMEYDGFGSFMAGQVVADMRWALEGTWEDKNRWAPIGPGSRRGMNRLHGRELEAGWYDEDFLDALLKFRDVAVKKLDKSITDRLEAIDYQNCLCEYDKYIRTQNGEGRPKRKYPGRG